jgi:hypothetical protein
MTTAGPAHPIMTLFWLVFTQVLCFYMYNLFLQCEGAYWCFSGVPDEEFYIKTQITISKTWLYVCKNAEDCA